MKRIVGIIIVLLCIGCQEKTASEEETDLIPREQFVSLLIDLEIMEAYYEQVHRRPQVYKTTLDSASKQIINESGFSEEMLRNTMLYYSSMPDTLFNLYEEALDSLNSMVMKNKNKTK